MASDVNGVVLLAFSVPDSGDGRDGGTPFSGCGLSSTSSTAARGPHFGHGSVVTGWCWRRRAHLHFLILFLVLVVEFHALCLSVSLVMW
ncbi:hypothetical protein RchiOBHm_Chr7g0237601 [Rosa chinensis]|uniref:Uncharacterized protein n=1 Tax=Rosa chinensis TaxID=74649 RepID=A0A2P6PH87_ROSCH|nr:hypothetical protein RchiOBHm_Chr7g0237601 [Rosa chinensis]